MREFLLIALGAAFGANTRYWLTQLFADRFGLAFPSGTLFINLSGSLLLGFLLTLVGQRFVADPGLRLLLGTGFLGAYTTFSTFSYDTIALLERGDWLPALLYAAASLFGSVFAAYLGIVLARLVG
jgi:CrcB protein